MPLDVVRQYVPTAEVHVQLHIEAAASRHGGVWMAPQTSSDVSQGRPSARCHLPLAPCVSVCGITHACKCTLCHCCFQVQLQENAVTGHQAQGIDGALACMILLAALSVGLVLPCCQVLRAADHLPMPASRLCGAPS